MTSNLPATSVTASITVDATPAQAFETFTNDIGSWWPPEHHLLQGTLERMVFEPRVGGAVYDVATDGSTCRWASVLAYEPPSRVVFSWLVSLAWELESDAARASEVEVRFVPEGKGRTRVELEHRHLDRHGDGWEAMRDAVGSPDGWMKGLRRLAARLDELAPTR